MAGQIRVALAWRPRKRRQGLAFLHDHSAKSAASWRDTPHLPSRGLLFVSWRRPPRCWLHFCVYYAGWMLPFSVQVWICRLHCKPCVQDCRRSNACCTRLFSASARTVCTPYKALMFKGYTSSMLQNGAGALSPSSYNPTEVCRRTQ